MKLQVFEFEPRVNPDATATNYLFQDFVENPALASTFSNAARPWQNYSSSDLISLYHEKLDQLWSLYLAMQDTVGQLQQISQSIIDVDAQILQCTDPATLIVLNIYRASLLGRYNELATQFNQQLAQYKSIYESFIQINIELGLRRDQLSQQQKDSIEGRSEPLFLKPIYNDFHPIPLIGEIV